MMRRMMRAKKFLSNVYIEMNLTVFHRIKMICLSQKGIVIENPTLNATVTFSVAKVALGIALSVC